MALKKTGDGTLIETHEFESKTFTDFEKLGDGTLIETHEFEGKTFTDFARAKFRVKNLKVSLSSSATELVRNIDLIFHINRCGETDWAGLELWQGIYLVTVCFGMHRTFDLVPIAL